MSFDFEPMDRSQIKIPGEENFHTITPYFMHMNLLNQVKSEIEGKAVYEIKEVCQLRFAGDRNYSPVVPVDSMYRKNGLRVITFAERWADQYRQFLANESQVAEGTPLEELTPYGITPAQLSLCRALKIYTIEALFHLEGSNLRSLGAHANVLKPMAKKYMEARRTGADQSAKIAELEKRIAEMAAPLPEKVATEEEIDVAYYEAMTEDELRDMIEKKTGTKPDGRLKHESLVNLAKGM